MSKSKEQRGVEGSVRSIAERVGGFGESDARHRADALLTRMLWSFDTAPDDRRFDGLGEIIAELRLIGEGFGCSVPAVWTKDDDSRSDRGITSHSIMLNPVAGYGSTWEIGRAAVIETGDRDRPRLALRVDVGDRDRALVRSCFERWRQWFLNEAERWGRPRLGELGHLECQLVIADDLILSMLPDAPTSDPGYADYSATSLDAPLSMNESVTLKILLKSVGQLMTARSVSEFQLTGPLALSEYSAKQALRSLEERGYVERPCGPKGGRILTPDGMARARKCQVAT